MDDRVDVAANALAPRDFVGVFSRPMESNDPKEEGAITPAPSPAVSASVISAPTTPDTIKIALPDASGVMAVVSPPHPGASSASGDDSLPRDLSVFFLNDALLSTFETLGALVFDMSQPAAVKLFPQVRPAVATLMGVDLQDPGGAALVDDALAKTLASYQRYLELNAAQLSFIQQVRVLLRDHDAPKKPIP